MKRLWVLLILVASFLGCIGTLAEGDGQLLRGFVKTESLEIETETKQLVMLGDQTISNDVLVRIQEELPMGEEIRHCIFNTQVAVAVTKLNEEETVYILEYIDGNWKVQGFNKTILHTYPIDEVVLTIDVFQDENGNDYHRIYVSYDSDRLAGWQEGCTIQMDTKKQWMITEYGFYDENLDFYLLNLIQQPEDDKNCMLIGAWGAESISVTFDMNFQYFNRPEAQELLKQSFEYETLKQIGNG